MKSKILKIIVIDNDLKYHEAYKNYFESYVDFSLRGIYDSVDNALHDFDSIQPDIIVSETSSPTIDGIAGISALRKKNPDTKIIIISNQSDFEVIKKAFKNGANGYLTKPVNKDRLYKALNSIKYEGATMSSDIVKKIISNFHKKTYAFLSERENQIIDYLSEGATYKMIANKLFVTTSAINFHIQNIYLKLNVNSKSEALSKLQEFQQV